MKKISLFLSLFLFVSILCAQGYRTQIFDDNIYSLQVQPNGEDLQTPIIALNSDDWIEISFDERGYEASNMYYKIIHCDASWSASSISSMEFLDGFDQNLISDFQHSENTTVNYIHYVLELPNEDVMCTLSGNYAVLIAKDNDFEDKLVACACFSVVEPMTNLKIGVTGKTMSELNGKYQQLNIDLNVDAVGAKDKMQDFVLVVRQNGRYDNEAILTRPTFVNGPVLQYSNIKDLEFEGGNQYRSFDFSSRYTYGSGIHHIEFDMDQYHVVLDPSSDRSSKRETYAYDAHGGYVVNLQKCDYVDTESDYMWVHFYFLKPEPFLEGNLYIIGDLTANIADEKSLVPFVLETECYEKTLLLKQGGYNYVFALKKKNDDKLTLLKTEGSFWQSKNKYEVFVYYRPFAAKYDRLVGYSVNKD